MKIKFRGIVLVSFGILLCGVGTAGQTTSTIEFTAINKENQTVKDLTPSEVELKVDGHSVEIRSLKLLPKRPPRMLLLFDTGYLALNNRSLLKDMVTAFIDDKPPSMEMALATINDSQQFLSPFQTSIDELVSTLQRVRFGGASPFSDSVLDALARFLPKPRNTGAASRMVAVAFSDGSDDSPRSQWDALEKMFAQKGYVFYEINHVEAMKAIFDYKYSDKDLIRLAEQTGGKAYRLKDLDEIGGSDREIYDRETLTYDATVSGEARASPADRNRIKIKSRRKDVRLEVVAVH